MPTLLRPLHLHSGRYPLLPFLVNKTPRYLKSSVCGICPPPPPLKGTSHYFYGERTMATDLEMLSLIPTTLHSAANHYSAHQRLQHDED
uniref:Uncharacterized protein n=1 Tax=Anguilla anguilla TaxID=7936 RepID=A0A0E9W8B2_ANGAN